MSDEKTINVSAEENEEALVDALFAKRISYDLTPDNSRFFLSEGGLVSMELSVPDKEKEFFERVIIIRTFPISNPNGFLSVRAPDSRGSEKGEEIGIIRDLNDFPEDTVKIILGELDKRYFIPEITKVHSIRDKYGFSYWDCDTSSGRRTFIVSNPYSNIRLLDDGRLLVEDMDGSNFCIPEKKKLDNSSQRKIEAFY